MSKEFDLVSIGGGLAGLSAAARAAGLGAKVAVLEKGTEPDYPCNSRFSGGVIHVAQHDVKRPEAELREIALAVTEGYADPDLLEVLITDTRRAVDWLRSCGANFVRGYNQNWIMAPPRTPVTHIVWKGLGADRTLKQLVRVISEAGGRLLQGHVAEDLIMEGGRCRGLVARHGDERLTIRASAVVIADGGFQANPDMMRRYIGPHPERIFQRNSGRSTGDGLRMARAVGAATTDLDRFYGHLLSRDAFANAEVWPYPLIDAVGLAGIMVDQTGKRLFDEGLDGLYLANQLATLEDPNSGIVLCDHPIWEKAGQVGFGPLPPYGRLEKAGGTMFKDNSLEALAARAGIDPKGLTETVASYNLAIKNGRLAGLTPPRSSAHWTPTSIATPPYYAIPVCAAVTNTMGGLAIDVHGRVKNVEGGTIEGLYAAGAATGGIEGGPKVVYVGGLCRAAVFGMRAAEYAVGRNSA